MTARIDTLINAELSRLLRAEISAGLAGLFDRRLQEAAPASSWGGGREISGGGISITVNNNTPAAVTVSEGQDAFDRKTLEITIDQMVADSLLRGRQTTGVMRTLFGLAPALFGR